MGDDDASEAELAELRALQSVGTRRRRRWLNERALRELAGPLTADDMQALFLPPPFGVIRESPLQQLLDNKAAASIWDSFRTIEHHRQERVLEVWAEHNKSLKNKKEGTNRVQGEEELSKITNPNLANAQEALTRWGRVSQQGRAALRKAHVQSVLALEMKVVEGGEEDIIVENGFGRLLVHSLCVFHGLHSVTRKDKSSVTIRKGHECPPPSIIMCCDVLGCLEELRILSKIDSLSPLLLSRYIETQGLAAAS